jgi:hypothetical protein
MFFVVGRMNQEWFELIDYRRRNFSGSVWVPLRSSLVEKKSDGSEETFCCGSIAVPSQHRAEAERLGWSDIGLIHEGGPYAFRDQHYKPAEVYQRNEGVDFGVELVLVQHPGNGESRIWHINQDLILALNLVQEGDVWVRPEECFVEVIKQVRNQSGDIVSIDIKREFLSDYLAARGLSLRLAYYRQRLAIIDNRDHITWTEATHSEYLQNHRFERRIFEVDEAGSPYGSTIGLFQVWRTDVDPDEDVPVFGPESDKNTDGFSTSLARGGKKFYRIEGELWREEWIDPASRSERVRGDESAETISYIIDAAGLRESDKTLNNEDIGRWLWFDPRVVIAIMQKRGSAFGWYTKDTGFLSVNKDYKVHFGINSKNLINAYAYDVARLPLWQQRVWAGYNVAPDGAVSRELLASQMETRPARTRAPEAILPELFDAIDDVAVDWLGAPLFREHDAADAILGRLHRFRGLEQGGILSLAKDVARLTADRIDKGALQKIVQQPKGENWGTLKSLEKALSTISSPEEARKLLATLVGIYELRLADAHLPSEKINEAYVLAGIDTSEDALVQGRQILEATVDALDRIGEAIHKRNEKRA